MPNWFAEPEAKEAFLEPPKCDNINPAHPQQQGILGYGTAAPETFSKACILPHNEKQKAATSQVFHMTRLQFRNLLKNYSMTSHCEIHASLLGSIDLWSHDLLSAQRLCCTLSISLWIQSCHMLFLFYYNKHLQSFLSVKKNDVQFIVQCFFLNSRDYCSVVTENERDLSVILLSFQQWQATNTMGETVFISNSLVWTGCHYLSYM